MGSSYFNCLMKASANAQQSSSLLIMVLDFILSNVIFNRLNNIERFFSTYWCFLLSQLSISSSKDCEKSASQHSQSFNKQFCFDKKKDDTNLRREEIKMVMENLGLFDSRESKELKDSINPDELSQLFDEKEPSLEEVKEAFDIFDQNKKGFIDAEDLQRVIHKLEVHMLHMSRMKSKLGMLKPAERLKWLWQPLWRANFLLYRKHVSIGHQ